MNNLYSIECTDMADFLDTIAGLVQRGIGFRAYANLLKIVPSGAY